MSQTYRYHLNLQDVSYSFQSINYEVCILVSYRASEQFEKKILDQTVTPRGYQGGVIRGYRMVTKTIGNRSPIEAGGLHFFTSVQNCMFSVRIRL